jgi:enoyl-CoA hydratase/carnithine racemase
MRSTLLCGSVTIAHHVRIHSVNEVVPNDQVLSRAIEIAKLIASNSPDAILSTKRGILEAHGDGNVDLASWRHIFSEENKRVYTGENIKVSAEFS